MMDNNKARKRDNYTTELTLAEYIEREQWDREQQAHKTQSEIEMARERLRELRDQRLKSLLSEDRCVNYENETIMNTTQRECKVETTDKVEFFEGKAPKFDANKVRLDLLPIRPLKDTAEVLTYGLNKYGKDSWREGEMIQWSRVYSSLQRHLFAFQSGEDLDPETGYSHLAHAACNILMMMEHTYINPQGDDRPTTAAPYKDAQ
jgi:hypothetical protein